MAGRAKGRINLKNDLNSDEGPKNDNNINISPKVTDEFENNEAKNKIKLPEI